MRFKVDGRNVGLGDEFYVTEDESGSYWVTVTGLTDDRIELMDARDSTLSYIVAEFDLLDTSWAPAD